MDCHETLCMINEFIDDHLTDEETIEFIEHIKHCHDCYDELEVYYMITTGIKLLEEEHQGNLDLRKSLKDLIEKRENEVRQQNKKIHRSHNVRHFLVAFVIVIAFIYGLIFFLPENSHTLNSVPYSSHVTSFRHRVITALEEIFGLDLSYMDTQVEIKDDAKLIYDHALYPAYARPEMTQLDEYKNRIADEKYNIDQEMDDENLNQTSTETEEEADHE